MMWKTIFLRVHTDTRLGDVDFGCNLKKHVYEGAARKGE